MDVFAKLEAAQLTFEDDTSAHIESSDDDWTRDADDVKQEFSPCRSDASCSPPASGFSAKEKEYLCNGCQIVITDSFLLKVSGLTWHESCLKCSVCGISLDGEESCYIRDNRVFCYTDYLEKFTSRCAKCNREISPSDWIRKAKGYLYHLDCFSCNVCGSQMNTGDKFGLSGTIIYCEDHCSKPQSTRPRKKVATKSIDTDGARRDAPASGWSRDSTESDSSVTSKENRGIKRRRSTVCEETGKRRRTAFTPEQVELLQEEFTINKNPTAEEYENMCEKTGLERRVVQVWFQNARANRKRKQVLE